MYAKCFWCNPNKTSRQSMHKYDFKINFYGEVLFIIIIIYHWIIIYQMYVWHKNPKATIDKPQDAHITRKASDEVGLLNTLINSILEVKSVTLALNAKTQPDLVRLKVG